MHTSSGALEAYGFLIVMGKATTAVARQQKITIAAIVALAAIIALLQVFSYLFIYRIEPWLNRFQSSLNIDRNQPKQEFSQKIEIVQQDQLVLLYEQKYAVDLTGQAPTASLTIVECSLGDINQSSFTQFLLSDGRMSTQIIIDDVELVNTSNESNIQAFWQLLDENSMVVNYNLSSNLSNIKLSAASRSLSAVVPKDKLIGMLDAQVLTTVASDATVNIRLDTRFRLSQFRIEHGTQVDEIAANAIITVDAIQTSQGSGFLSAWQIVLIILSTVAVICIAVMIVVCFVQRRKNRLLVTKSRYSIKRKS